MKKVTYKCNLCWEPKERSELICLYLGVPKGELKDRYHLVENLDLSDKHICKECIEIIKNYGEK